MLSIIGCLLVALVWGRTCRRARASNSAASQQTDITVLATIATPVVIGVLLYFGWALTFWRQKPGDETDAAPIHGNTRIQAIWIIVTSAIVLALAVYGTVELIAPAGAGAGQGPQPIFKRGMPPATSVTSWTPGTNNILQVQVIGQQWAWTYRYPQFGGFETTAAACCRSTSRCSSTSPRSTSSTASGPTQLGVKADANPGVNNVAYTDAAARPASFQVRCAELCGIWHGAMYDYGKVMPVSDFMTWAHATEMQLADVTKLLPPYALTYDPTVVTNMGKVNAAARPDRRGRRFLQPGGPGAA